MIDLREIRETIDEIKRHGTTVGQAEKLALLYIAADHMEREEAERQNPENVERGYSQAAAPEPQVVSVEHRSDFLVACDGVPVEKILDVIDEHMEAIRVLYPKEYDAIVQKMSEIQ
ncbi:MAG: hypothetical protein J6K55_11445 [Clostridia bacterium]|nr:hypothetical protein [Clostridia bacterium]